MSEASATGHEVRDEHGLLEEIAMLRQLMRRLMTEDEDMVRLVTGVTRLSSALVQVVRIERSLAERPDDRMNEAIKRAMAELERQEALGAGARERA